MPSVQTDSFARDHLPAPQDWPQLSFTLPELRYPERLNCGAEFLDKMVAQGFGGRPCVRTGSKILTYQDMLETANRIARVLTEDLGLVPGNRVLLRSANNAMMLACWLAVFKAGGVAVGTMPLYRARELGYILNKAQVKFALCDARLADELKAAGEQAPSLKQILYFNSDASDSLDALMAKKSGAFTNCDTALDDVALIAFTSGTTGPAKGTVHFHRDVMAICDCFPRSTLKPTKDDIFCGSPPLAFTFGLGGLALFPMRFGASTALAEKATPDVLPQIIYDHKATIVFTAPTAYRVMADNADSRHLASLKKGV